MAMTPPDLRHDISACFDSLAAPVVRLALGGGPAVTARVLRFTTGAVLRSVIAEIPPRWSLDAGMGTTGHLQAYVLAGAIVLDGHRLPAGAFFVQRGGTGLQALSAPEGARLLLVFDGAPQFSARTPAPPIVLLPDTLAVTPITPVVNGVRKEGFSRRVLWLNEATGADTRLLQVAPFEGTGPSWHPVHEEIFCLAGDIGPDDRRLMKPGWYLHNPAFGVHGYHEHSRGGATVLEWHDGAWASHPA